MKYLDEMYVDDIIINLKDSYAIFNAAFINQ